MEEEYELIPLSPIRRLEKRLTKIEGTATTGEMMQELMDIIKTNQHVVDSMTRTNSALVNKVTDLSNSVDKLMRKIDDFLERIEEPGVEAEEDKKSEELEKKLDERLSKMEKRVNSMLLSSFARKRAVPNQMQAQAPAM